MTMNATERFHLKKLVKELESYRGRHTELVTVYVPTDYDLVKISQHIAQEQGTASNIKSKSTRDNVIGALEKMIQHLRLFKNTPPNGLAIFAGNISQREGGQDIRVWSFEPPEPLNQRLYRCDKQFVLEPLLDMMDVKKVYGLLVIDRRDATIALLKGKTIVPLVKTHSEVPGKTKAGGQSAARFERLREGAALDHFKKVAEYMKDNLLGMNALKGIIIGGPGMTKYEFLDLGQLTQELKDKVIAIKDLSYTEEFGLQELLDKSQDVLANEEVADEKSIVNKFLHLLATRPKIVEYGERQVFEKLSLGMVETLLLSESLSDQTIEKFECEALKFSSVIKIISTETREGVQLRDIGKIGAILRYEQG